MQIEPTLEQLQNRAMATGTAAPAPTSTTLAQDLAKAQNQGRAGYDVLGNPISTAISSTTPTFNETPEEKALREARATQTSYNQGQANQTINEAQIRADVLAQMQAEIDAQNAVYADKLSRAKVAGEGRLGESGAVQARRGLLGSDFGAAQTDTVRSGNEQIYGSIENEKQAVVQSLLAKGRELGQKAIAEKRAAKEAGLSNYIESLSKSTELAKGRASEIALSILNSGTDYSQLDPTSVASIAQSAGVNVDQIKNAYTALKQSSDAQALKTKTEAEKNVLESVKTQADIDRINQQIASGQRDSNKPIEVGGYVYKPDGQGNWVNSGTKFTATTTTNGVVGTYVAGANPVVDSWANRIQNGSAKITDIPSTKAELRNQVSVALDAMGNSPDGKPTTTELGKAALGTATTLMDMFNKGKGTSMVGASRIFGGGIAFPGTDSADFGNNFDSLKSQLALEGIKYLKGQGAVSDAERALLAQAVTKLSLSQSEDEFKKTLQGIIDKLSGNTPNTPANVYRPGMSSINTSVEDVKVEDAKNKYGITY